MADFILETCGLTRHDGGVHSLTDAGFVRSKGEHVAIMGDNGAGKSSVVRQITGVDLPNLTNIRNTSGGQRHCVAIARTAVFKPKLVIMDKPTAALGVQETARVRTEFADAA